jgi:hypothetical protein
MNSHAKLDSLVGLDPSDEAFLLSPIGKTQKVSKELGITIHRIVRVSVGSRACEPGKTRCSATRRLARNGSIAILKRTLSGFHFFHMMNTEGPTRRRQLSGGCRNASLVDWMADNLTWRAQPLCATDRSFRGCICG